MTPEEMRFVWAGLGGLGAGGLVACFVAWLLFKHYLPSYLGQKGKNLADKEDIAALTHEVEAIKGQYSKLLEEFKSHQQLRMVAAERRIQVHQEAFALWRKLIANVYNDRIGEVVIECQGWWENHCLYLEPEAREAFSLAYARAHGHAAVVDGSRGTGNASVVEAHWKGIMDCGQILLHAVKLPGLSPEEQKVIPAPWTPPPH